MTKDVNVSAVILTMILMVLGAWFYCTWQLDQRPCVGHSELHARQGSTVCAVVQRKDRLSAL